MLTGIIVFIVILLVGGIILLNGQSSSGHKPREKFLKELADFWEGELQASGSQEESSKVHFVFDGRKFIFEDVEEKGFKDKINKAYLKLALATDFDLYFTQKEQKSVQMKTIIASDIQDEAVKEGVRINTPVELKDFYVHTNNPKLSNKIFENVKVRRILDRLKNRDARGYPSIPLRILNGVIILEFYAEGSIKPRLHDLHQNVSALEHHLKVLVDVAKTLESFKFV